MAPNWRYRTWGQQRGRSRNKVVVGEPAGWITSLVWLGTTLCKGLSWGNRVTELLNMQFPVFMGDEGRSGTIRNDRRV